MKSRLALVTVLAICALILPGCGNKTSNNSNPDQAWIQWATDSVNTLDSDLMNLYPYQPYDQPAYTDMIHSAANQLKTDCSNSIEKGKNLTSSPGMKARFENFKSALSFYYQGADILSADSSPVPYSSRIVTATQDFEKATDFMNKADLPSFMSAPN